MELQKLEIVRGTFSRKPQITRDVSLRDPSRDNPTEAAIQDLIADGKFEEACDSAYCAYRGEIVAYCSHRLRGKVSEHRGDGEEITQQVFLEFWKALRGSNYKPSKASVRTFIYDIADKRIIGKLRTPNRSIPGRDAEVREFDLTDSCSSYSTNPELLLLEQEKSGIFNWGLDKLHCLDRIIINLRRGGDSIAIIARITGLKEGTIRIRLWRAVAKLRKICNGTK